MNQTERRQSPRMPGIIAGICLLLLCQAAIAEPTVTLTVDPDIREITLSPAVQQIFIIADIDPPDAAPIWTFSGPGTFQGDVSGMGILYMPPPQLNCGSADVTISVSVPKADGAKLTESVRLTLIASTPPSPPTPTATPTSIATPTPVPTATTAQLTVRSNVYGDLVSINGQKHQATPLTIELPLGEYRVRIEKDGCTPYETIFALQQDATLRGTLACPTPTPTPTSTPKPHSTPTPRPTSTPKPHPTPTPRFRLRSQPKTVSLDKFRQVFNLDSDKRPRVYVDNNFTVKNNTVVIDAATGLTWQRSGSAERLNYSDAQDYNRGLNRERFGGYSDWRLPTVEELLSLVERRRTASGLYIDPAFDKRVEWCWTSDKGSSESAWVVGFYYGDVYWYDFNGVIYVRAVRS